MNKVVLQEDVSKFLGTSPIINVNNNFNYGSFTTIIDLATLVDTHLNVLSSAIIDVTNTGPSDMNYKILSGTQLLQQGLIEPDKILSFETRRPDLSIQVDGVGNIKGTITYVRA